MEGVERVDQLDDRRLHWVASFGRSTHEWDAEITEQVPDQRVAWRSVDGKTNTGQVTFHPADAGKTEVTVEMGWKPRGSRRRSAARSGSTTAGSSRTSTGAWRGEQR